MFNLIFLLSRSCNRFVRIEGRKLNESTFIMLLHMHLEHLARETKKKLKRKKQMLFSICFYFSFFSSIFLEEMMMFWMRLHEFCQKMCFCFYFKCFSLCFSSTVFFSSSYSMDFLSSGVHFVAHCSSLDETTGKIN